jgi:hypothetical protein
MTPKIERHLVENGDDSGTPKAEQARCTCGWRFSDPDSQVRLRECYSHLHSMLLAGGKRGD